MTNMGGRTPALGQTLYASPRGVSPLAATPKHPSPDSADLVAEGVDRPAVERHVVILRVSPDDRFQVRSHLRNRPVQAAPQGGLDVTVQPPMFVDANPAFARASHASGLVNHALWDKGDRHGREIMI